MLPAEVRTPRSSPRPGLKEAESGWPTTLAIKTAFGTACNGDHVEITVDLDRATRGIAPALQKERPGRASKTRAFRTMRFGTARPPSNIGCSMKRSSVSALCVFVRLKPCCAARSPTNSSGQM